jgi:peptide/nickel transport system ATP-binding protein
VGESGSGKTTILRAIMGLLPDISVVDEKSKILFDSCDLTSLSAKEWDNLLGFKISMIFQDYRNMLNPVRSIGSQFVEYIRAKLRISKKDSNDLAKNMLAKTGLSSIDTVMKSYPFQLSGGMRQRVGVAMSTVFNPRLLLADEPTSSLDVTNQKQVIELLMALKLKQNMTMILVTHNLGIALYVSDRIIVLRDGIIVE